MTLLRAILYCAMRSRIVAINILVATVGLGALFIMNIGNWLACFALAMAWGHIVANAGLAYYAGYVEGETDERQRATMRRWTPFIPDIRVPPRSLP